MHHLAKPMVAVLAGALMAVMTAAVPAAGASGSPSVPHYDHIFLIVEENHGFADVIGNRASPNLNALANRFGLATRYFGVAHPSEPNYVALMGGTTSRSTTESRTSRRP